MAIGAGTGTGSGNWTPMRVRVPLALWLLIMGLSGLLHVNGRAFQKD